MNGDTTLHLLNCNSNITPTKYCFKSGKGSGLCCSSKYSRKVGGREFGEGSAVVSAIFLGGWKCGVVPGVEWWKINVLEF